jgi:nuclear transport factor 2 (NTF2) superfamily protein
MSGRTSVDPRPEVQRALERVRAAENACNLRDVDGIVMDNSIDCQWRSRAEFMWGREQIRSHIARKWRSEAEYRVISELWAADGDRIAIRFAFEYRDDNRAWFRAHGTESWELNASGQVRRRFTSVNEHPIQEHERLLRWPLGVRPDDHPTLSELGI